MVDIKNGALGAYADVATDGFFDTAEASAESASHHIFERNEAVGAAIASGSCDGFHHGSGTAAVYAVVIGGESVERSYQAMVPGGAVVGGEVEVSIGYEEAVDAGDVGCGAPTDADVD